MIDLRDSARDMRWNDAISDTNPVWVRYRKVHYSLNKKVTIGNSSLSEKWKCILQPLQFVHASSCYLQ